MSRFLLGINHQNYGEVRGTAVSDEFGSVRQEFYRSYFDIKPLKLTDLRESVNWVKNPEFCWSDNE